MVLLGFRKLYWIILVADYQTMTMTFFGASLALESAFELLGPGWSLPIVVHFSSHVTVQLRNGSSLNRIEKMTLRNVDFFFFYLWSANEALTYQAF